MVSLNKLIAIILLQIIGGWIMSPGKGSHASAAAGIGTETDTDAFTRANANPLDGNWTTNISDNPFQLSSNTAIPQNIGVDSVNIRTGTWGADQFSAAKITVTGSGVGTGPGVAVRCATASQTYYRLVVDASGNFELAKFVSGSYSSLRTGTLSYSAGTELALSVSGSSTAVIKIWYGGSQVGADYNDSSSPITTGNPGLSYSSASSTAIVDDWRGGTVP